MSSLSIWMKITTPDEGYVCAASECDVHAEPGEPAMFFGFDDPGGSEHGPLCPKCWHLIPECVQVMSDEMRRLGHLDKSAELLPSIVELRQEIDTQLERFQRWKAGEGQFLM